MREFIVQLQIWIEYRICAIRSIFYSQKEKLLHTIVLESIIEFTQTVGV